MESVDPRNVNGGIFGNPLKIRGFSLVELLVVLALISIILAISAQSLSKVSGAALLTSTGDNLISVLVEAQQNAIADNSTTEVRFYQPVDSDALIAIWSVLLVRENEDGTHRVIRTPVHLPNGVIFNRSSALSSLIGSMTPKEDEEDLLANSASEGALYTSFEFYSNGSTSLPASSSGDTWHVTLVKSTEDGTSSVPPGNFFTIRIDPFTGGVRSFRP